MPVLGVPGAIGTRSSLDRPTLVHERSDVFTEQQAQSKEGASVSGGPLGI